MLWKTLEKLLKNKELVLKLQLCEYKISSGSEISETECCSMYERSADCISEHPFFLNTASQAIDVQTTEAGPGVGTSEKMVRLRLTESFILNDLDLQYRFHFTPRDSKSHKVEQVMSALNEAVGDGRFIDIERKSVFETKTEAELLQMTPDDFKTCHEKGERSIGIKCAEKVSTLYNGTACMFTTIH